MGIEASLSNLAVCQVVFSSQSMVRRSLGRVRGLSRGISIASKRDTYAR